MRMTDSQAKEYCRQQALHSLDGTPSGEGKSIRWNHIRGDIENEGLDEVEDQLSKLVDEAYSKQKSQVSVDVTVEQGFLDAIYDDDIIQRYIAVELKEKVSAEMEKCEMNPLRYLYLQRFYAFLGNVEDDSADLKDYPDVKDEILEELKGFEEVYGKWVVDATDE